MEHILGQNRAVEVLAAALRSGRLHHCYIFHGPAGVGKFTTARAFAKILLCPNAQTDLVGNISACDQCRACHLCEAGTHPDRHLVRKELASDSAVAALRTRKQMNIPVDLLREHIVGGTTGDGKYHEAIAYKTPVMRHHKVFIIDEAELMDPTGQNAMLKTLEEPPAGTYFILICANEDRLLPTVRSRSQRVAFVPLSEAIIAQWLARRPEKLEGELRDWLTGFAEGSLGRCELVLEYELTKWAARVRPVLWRMPAGGFDANLGREIHTMINDFAETWVKRHTNASKDAANKLAVQLMWSLLAHEARRQLALLAQDCDPADPDAGEQTLGPWLAVIAALDQALGQINSNVNMGLVCDNVISAIYRALEGAAMATPARV